MENVELDRAFIHQGEERARQSTSNQDPMRSKLHGRQSISDCIPLQLTRCNIEFGHVRLDGKTGTGLGLRTQEASCKPGDAP